jgi:hypothetical protein
MWQNQVCTDGTIWGHVVNEEDQRRTAFVELGRLHKVTPGASVYVGFAVGEEPTQQLARGAPR